MNSLELSPKAQKARHEAQGRARGYWPHLQRTNTHLILRRPTRGGRKYQANFAHYVAKELPQFAFSARRNWWQADLNVANVEAVTRANTQYRELQLNVSQGVKTWLKAADSGG